MNRLISIAAAAVAAISAASCSHGESLADYVDPRIGTAHSRWFFFTPAAVPFGMAKPAPTTDGHLGNPGGWQAVGYDARHTSIEGFANFHEFQVGGVVLAPTSGILETFPGEVNDTTCRGYRSSFDKADEVARPGYYSVILKDYGIKAELTSTERVAFHRYTYSGRDTANLIFNIGTKMGESGPCKDARVEYKDGRVEGWVTTYPVYVNNYQKGADVTMYFSAEVDTEPDVFGTFSGSSVNGGNQAQDGKGAGFYMRFAPKDRREVNVKVGLSYTSVDNARNNLLSEASSVSFDAARRQACRKWESALGRIRVEGGKIEDRVKFYTGLYHALLGRGLASDVNGAYPKNDGTTGNIPLGKDGKPLHNHYNTDAIWGGFWNLTQLWSLAYPEYFADWISSQLLVYKDAGWLGDGIACSRYVSGVGTNFVSLAIAAAYNCGIRNFDINTAYEAALKNEVEWRDRPAGAGKLDVYQFVTKGYSPLTPDFYDHTSEKGSKFSVSHTLEYSFSSYAVAQMAASLGHEADYERLSALSEGWKLVYDPSVKLMRPRDTDGEFIEDFDPYAPWVGFQEGNAIQYTWYVPHHVEQLVDLLGADEFNSRLDSTFIISRESIFGGGKTIDAFSGLQSYYNHGNQPNLHISGMFNFSGKPWLSQKWMRTICNEFYGTDGIHGYGYGQDEDQGQLGAWYVMAAMGLFDVKGLTSPNPSMQVCSPLFDKVTISLNRDYYPGKEFVIRTLNNSDSSIYISGLTLDGKPLDSVQLPWSSIVSGGELVLEMSETPDESLTK